MLAQKSSLPKTNATGTNFPLLDNSVAVLQISTILIIAVADSKKITRLTVLFPPINFDVSPANCKQVTSLTGNCIKQKITKHPL